MKSRLLMMIAVLVLIPLVIGACTGEASIPATPPASGQPKDVPAPPVSTGPLSPDDIQFVAEELVRISETFLFDGIEESLKLVSVQAGQQPDSWTFTFEFQSRHAGYGDRTGEMLAQVITPHKVVVTVEKDEITAAVMDGEWDILQGEA